MLHRFAVLLLLLVLPATVLAQTTPQLHWERYDNIVEIRADGSIQVREQQSLIVDRGPARGMTRVFETGAAGAISEIRVFEDGQLLSRQGSLSTRDPGTYAGADNGRQAEIRVNFLNPNADRHSITIQYVIKQTLSADNNRATFDWNFFWSNPDAPEIRDGSVLLRFPGTVSAAQLSLDTGGVSVRQSSTSDSVRWELTQPIRGRDLDVTASFPRALLAQNAQFRAASSTGAPNTSVPTVPTPGPAAATGLGIGGMMFCLFILLFLFIAFMIIRASMRSQRARGYSVPSADYDQGSFGAPFGLPQQRRRRRRYGDRDGGFGFPPIIIMPPSQPPSQTPSPFDNNNTPSDSGSGGGSSSWGDSGGGSSSWGDSGGGSSFWGSSSGGSSSWGDSGGGSSSWGGGDSGGSSDSGGGSGGGSFD